MGGIAEKADRDQSTAMQSVRRRHGFKVSDTVMAQCAFNLARSGLATTFKV
jgi:hypothetical protein